MTIVAITALKLIVGTNAVSFVGSIVAITSPIAHPRPIDAEHIICRMFQVLDYSEAVAIEVRPLSAIVGVAFC